MVAGGKPNRYEAIIARIFQQRYKKGALEFEFDRTDIDEAARDLKIVRVKNVGDLIYAFRYRAEWPATIAKTQSKGRKWVIEGRGKGRYAFLLVSENRLVPRTDLIAVKIPDATPEIVEAHALSDEQALLAKVRYNRLVDIFLGIATFSLQNHLRTTVSGMGQVEIDEIYVGVDSRGRQYVIPIQAKGGSDQLSAVQAKQDIRCCEQKFPALICRSISAQFMSNDVIAMFELALEGTEVRIRTECHFRLVPAADISPDDLQTYSR